MEHIVTIKKPWPEVDVLNVFEHVKTMQQDLTEWCEENCGDPYEVKVEVSALRPLITGKFEALEDAVLFKLRWL